MHRSFWAFPFPHRLFNEDAVQFHT